MLIPVFHSIGDEVAEDLRHLQGNDLKRWQGTIFYAGIIFRQQIGKIAFHILQHLVEVCRDKGKRGSIDARISQQASDQVLHAVSSAGDTLEIVFCSGRKALSIAIEDAVSKGLNLA